MKKISYIELSSFKNKFKSFKKYITIKGDFDNFKTNAIEAKFLRNIPIEKHVLIIRVQGLEIYIPKSLTVGIVKKMQIVDLGLCMPEIAVIK